MARAHRLGQTNKVMLILDHLMTAFDNILFIWFLTPFYMQVMIFRLITRGTIEERMMQMTKKKMVLEHLVVGKLKNQSINQVKVTWPIVNICIFNYCNIKP